MSPECELFIQSVLNAIDFTTGAQSGPPDWDNAFRRLIGLNMYEMLRALAALDSQHALELLLDKTAGPNEQFLRQVSAATRSDVRRRSRVPARLSGDRAPATRLHRDHHDAR